MSAQGTRTRGVLTSRGRTFLAAGLALAIVGLLLVWGFSAARAGRHILPNSWLSGRPSAPK